MRRWREAIYKVKQKNEAKKPKGKFRQVVKKVQKRQKNIHRKIGFVKIDENHPKYKEGIG